MNKWFKNFIWLVFFAGLIYGSGRLYFKVTGGFTVGNITSDYAYNPAWETEPLAENEQKEVEAALSQRYYYLGKGCQSYVFVSQDDQYVVKFFKYQRYRLQPWIKALPGFSPIEAFRQKKLASKEKKREAFFASWKVANDHLREEAGLLYIHLNKSHDLNKQLVIVDKIGLKHTLNMDNMEFLIQKRADMFCPTLLNFKKNNDLDGAQTLISRLFTVIMSEYQRGLADNDHALMQNTGVMDGNPIHIDVGQFVRNDVVKEPQVYKQELFTKMYKFRAWLKEEYPELLPFVDKELETIIGPEFRTMKPIWRIHEDRIPNMI